MAQRQWRSDDTDQWLYGFGDGSDGSSYSIPANEGCSGSSGGTSLTLASAGSFSNGDLVLIHQTRGSGAGNWELNKIASGAGTTSLTMEHDLTNTYTDSGDNQAQIIELKQYENLTTGSITAPNWDHSKGGIIAFFDKDSTTVNGTLNLDGATGNDNYNADAPAEGGGAGFDGGKGSSTQDGGGDAGESGEGTGGARAVQTSANGNGGGGGNAASSEGSYASGGGGGNGTAGGNGAVNGGTGGSGGSTSGNSQLTNITFGGGGGGGGINGGGGIAGGGSGAGICFIFSKNLSVTGAISLDGGNGGNRTAGQPTMGGGGAGGSCLIKCVAATLGTNKITASGGPGGTSGNGDAGDGGSGRIHLDYSSSYTGSTSPTLSTRNDLTVAPLFNAGGSFLYNFV